MTSHELLLNALSPELTKLASESDEKLISLVGDSLADLMPLEGLGSLGPIDRITHWMATQTQKMKKSADSRARAVLQALEDDATQHDIERMMLIAQFLIGQYTRFEHLELHVLAAALILTVRVRSRAKRNEK